MNLLFLSHIWPPAIDGGSQIVFYTQNYLNKLGHQSLVITTNCNSTDDFIDPTSSTLIQQNKNIIRLPVFKSKIFLYLSKIFPYLSILKIGPIFTPFSFLKVLRKINKFHPEIIIAGPYPTLIPIYAYILKKIYKSKLLIIPCFHHQDKSFSHPFLQKVLKKSDLIWTLSSFEKRHLKKHYLISKNKFFISPPGINIKPLHHLKIKPKGKFEIIFLGNFAAHKRIEDLISAFSFVYKSFPFCHLTIAGQPTLYYPQILKFLQTMPKKVKQKITIIPKKYNQNQLTQLLDQSHLLVNPSINESFGIVFIEAASRGVPVIGTDIPTVKRLITKNQIGLYFPSGNSQKLSEIIIKLITNRSLYTKFSKNGLKLTNYQWPDIITRLNKKIAQI